MNSGTKFFLFLHALSTLAFSSSQGFEVSMKAVFSQVWERAAAGY